MTKEQWLRCVALAILIALPWASLRAQTARGASSAAKPCLYDAETGYVENCLSERKGVVRVSPRVLKRLKFEPNGLAAVCGKDDWMYVDRRGRVRIAGVPTFDNWADAFQGGLVRVQRNGKWGFVNERGAVVIPLDYDGALSFDGGHAKACKACTLKTDGEHRWFDGGQWSCLDTHGRSVDGELCAPRPRNSASSRSGTPGNP